ncbi:MAG: hypothetical protein OEY97_13460 [Nitrospirota bacterium]|nr:hypothetical protein [Nitrospirota bacterium]
MSISEPVQYELDCLYREIETLSERVAELERALAKRNQKSSVAKRKRQATGRKS